MGVSRERLWVLLVAQACCAHALIIYNNGLDETTHNTTTAGMPPGLDAAWDSVAFVSPSPPSFNASAVYLGDGFFLTARHVDALYPGQAKVSINAAEYVLDARFGDGGILNVEDIPGVAAPVDLKIFKVLAPPSLPPVALDREGTRGAFTAYAIGCGRGKGAAVPGQGWAWGLNATRQKRWGLVRVVEQESIEEFGSCLVSVFSTAHGADVASATLGDSGSGLFQCVSGAWVLCGVPVTVTTDGYSYYNKGGVAPEAPDMTAHVRVADYADAILSAITDIAAEGVTIPGLWLRAYFPSAPFDSYAAVAGQTAANGLNTVAQCYVAGLDPTNASSRFLASIVLSNGTPRIAWSPDLGAERVYHVQGKADLSDFTWCATNSATRFFRVRVEM